MNYLAIDLGAGSGRGIIGTVANGKISVKEIHRFVNQPIRIGDSFHWNLPSLLTEIKTAIQKALLEVTEIAGIGVDTWGVDYGLLDRNGKLIGVPYSYRDSRTTGILEEAFNQCSKEEIFQLTGNQLMEINTAFQLYSQKKSNDPQLEIAEHLLFMPDLFNFLLTGKMVNEYTIASTSQLLHADKREWSDDLFEKLDLPRKLMKEIVYPGTVIGQLSASICEELNCPPIDVMAVGSHDTASALAAVPASDDKNWAFLSSGTWSLMGMEIDQPLFTKEAYQNCFTNEGAVGGKIRFLKNITGLWILQQLMHEWRKMERSTEFGTMISDAELIPQQAIIDVDAPDFQNPVSMMEAIANYCKNSNQTPPETNGEYMRCIVDSLSVKYGEVAKNMATCTGKTIERLHIIGGGCQNALLNQLTANVLNAEVVAGPIEATALGNIMVQAIAKGEIASLAVGRNMIKDSEKLKVFYPNN